MQGVRRKKHCFNTTICVGSRIRLSGKDHIITLFQYNYLCRFEWLINRIFRDKYHVSIQLFVSVRVLKSLGKTKADEFQYNYLCRFEITPSFSSIFRLSFQYNYLCRFEPIGPSTWNVYPAFQYNYLCRFEFDARHISS